MPKPTGDRLELLYRISQTINSSLDLDTVLDVLIDESIKVTRAERGLLMLYDADKQLALKTARGIDRSTVEETDFKSARSLVEQVAKKGQPLLAGDAQTEFPSGKRANRKLAGLRSVLCVPIRHKDEILGAVYVDNRCQNGVFNQADLELLESIASSAGIAIENARLYQLAVERGRVERELQMARAVQAGLIPTDTPKIPGWELAAYWRPAHEVGGDFYDFMALPDGRTGIVVADVSDKGMPAAIFMALTRSILRAAAGQNDSPAADIAQASRLIWHDSAAEMYVTLCYACLSPRDGRLVYVNAGHNPPLLLRSAGGEIRELERTGMAAGVESDTLYQEGSLEFETGDSLLIYTDGMIDAIGAQGHFGEQRLKEAFKRFSRLDAHGTVAALEKELCTFSNDDISFDDITMLVIKRIG